MYIFQRTRFTTGTYTGDGTVAQAITGLGFTPRFLRLTCYQDTGANDIYEFYVSDLYTVGRCEIHFDGTDETNGTRINSLDIDGFNVDDAGTDQHPNKNGYVYMFTAWG